MRRSMGGWGWAGSALIVVLVLFFTVPWFHSLFAATVRTAGLGIQGAMPESLRKPVLDEQRVDVLKEEKSNLTNVALAKQQFEMADEQAQESEAAFQKAQDFGKTLLADLEDGEKTQFVYVSIGREYTREEANNMLGKLASEVEQKKAKSEQLRALANARLASLTAAETRLSSIREMIHELDLDRIHAETALIQAESAEASSVEITGTALSIYKDSVSKMRAEADARLAVVAAQQTTESVINTTGKAIPRDNLELARKAFGVDSQ